MTSQALTTTTTPNLPTPAEDVAQLVKDWHQAMDLLVAGEDLAQTSRNTYAIGLGKFLEWSSTQGKPQATTATIREWKAAMVAAGCKPGSVNTWLAGVRAFFTWACEEGRLATNPAENVKGAKRTGTSKKHKREALTDAEVLRVLAIPDRNTSAGKRDYAILALMAYTAARSVEVHLADIDNLKTEGGRLVLAVQGKGRQEADEVLVLANPEAEAAMRDWLAVRGQTPGALFVGLGNRSHERLALRTIRGMVKAAYAAAGVVGANKTTHSLRHSAITAAVKGGAPVQKVQTMARHEQINTTLIYFHEVDRVTNPAEAFIAYGGK